MESSEAILIEPYKLAGKRVAIKDNICVAGVPMMNGASVLEGYVPDIDATVVTRILDAGGESVAHTLLEGDLTRQAAALWAWCEHAHELPAPVGTRELERGVIGSEAIVLDASFAERELRWVVRSMLAKPSDSLNTDDLVAPAAAGRG